MRVSVPLMEYHISTQWPILQCVQTVVNGAQRLTFRLVKQSPAGGVAKEQEIPDQMKVKVFTIITNDEVFLATDA